MYNYGWFLEPGTDVMLLSEKIVSEVGPDIRVANHNSAFAQMISYRDMYLHSHDENVMAYFQDRKEKATEKTRRELSGDYLFWVMGSHDYNADCKNSRVNNTMKISFYREDNGGVIVWAYGHNAGKKALNNVLGEEFIGLHDFDTRVGTLPEETIAKIREWNTRTKASPTVRHPLVVDVLTEKEAGVSLFSMDKMVDKISEPDFEDRVISLTALIADLKADEPNNEDEHEAWHGIYDERYPKVEERLDQINPQEMLTELIKAFRRGFV